MDKDRDISRSVTTITPKKVGFVSTAVLAGSAFVAACGGGDSRSTGTPEGGVGGAQSNPTTGQTIEVKTAALPSATVVQEAPTATVEASSRPRILSAEEVVKVSEEAATKIRKAFNDLGIPNTDDYTDPDKITKSLTDCANKYNDPKYKNQPTFNASFLASCELAARATKEGWENHRDSVDLLEANRMIRDVHYTGFKSLMVSDPGLVTESKWTAYETMDYIPQ